VFFLCLFLLLVHSLPEVALLVSFLRISSQRGRGRQRRVLGRCCRCCERRKRLGRKSGVRSRNRAKITQSRGWVGEPLRVCSRTEGAAVSGPVELYSLERPRRIG
jgi:hypothetical protein